MPRSHTFLIALLLGALSASIPAQEKGPDLIAKGLELARRLQGDAATDFIRVVKGKETARLETAAVTYEDLDRGLSVTLVAAVHIGDRAYYEALQKLLDDYDLVLFEGINRDTEEPDELLLMVGRLQRLMKKALRLDFQPEQMDMTRPNMVRADIDASKLTALLEERGVGLIPNENMVRMLFPVLEKAFSYLSDDSKPEGRMTRIFRDKLKRSMADVLGGGLDIYEKLKRDEDRLRDEVIIGVRNQRAFTMLEAEVAKNPRRKLAIIYGAAHQPDFERRLVEGMGLAKTGLRWFPAWVMGQEEPPKPVAEPAPVDEPKPDSRPAKKI